ncbi:TIGR03619 family F420-dependent LLM class oxidoreductase [Dactylosporangium sp. AC04546]|uniref:TIGR03619 family F420-dependent LLM class oxidoreductase n=1 Tax=Dactylosporangium sp. AC04546 TaxID=2862460 RepID=UPI001EDCAC20|nr:TIGR03619 family F420-dependent LLM class oxidoreductase [Dactylosporangium sp. AC04546]WVK89106.1 TIGR03619 family F420-dependent LLM class oxidoreductase [Dactylosporangium sp. AC04546]
MARLGFNLMGVDELYGGRFSGILEAAALADRAGVDLLVLPDHVTISEQAHRDRVTVGFPYPISTNWYEPLTALAAVAAVTERARLGTNVLVAPIRPAVLLAKQLATLDVICGGRLDAGLGAGWQVEEYRVTERPFEGRFGYIEEQVAVCRALWAGGPAAHAGRRLDFTDLHSMPVPVQGADLRLSFGFNPTPRAIERIVRLGVGWWAAPMPVEAVRAAVAGIREECERAGRDPASVTVTAATTLVAHGRTAEEVGAMPVVEEAQALWDAGADCVIVHPLAFVRSAEELPEFLKPLLDARDAHHSRTTLS